MARIRRARRWPNAPKRKKKKVAPKPRILPPREPPPKLKPFQREGVDFLAANKWNVLLADAPGAGKTPQALVALKENQPKLTPALAVVPASVSRNWRREARRWMPGLRVQLIDTLAKRIRPNRHLTVTTWDLLASRREEFLAYGFKCLIADEAHYAKNPETQRSIAVSEIAEQTKRVLLLTGTPLINDAEELEVLQRLFSTKNPPMLRRLLEEAVPEIPPKRRVTLQAAIPHNIRAEYEQVVSEFDEWLEQYLPHIFDDPDAVDGATQRALAAEPLAKLGYLRRILGRGKVPAAAAWVRQMQRRKEPVVVFGQYTDVLDLLGQALSKLGIAFTRLDGTCSQEQRQAAVDAFQRGEIDVFLGSSAAREGITLHRAAHLLFLERWYTSSSEEQAEDRIRRIGQTRATTIWYLHAEDSIDDRISDIVEGKRALIAQTIGSATIEHTELDDVLDVWKRMKELKMGVPLVAANPKATLDLPKLPPPRRVYSIIFNSRAWPMGALQRHLRNNGYRQRKIERKGDVIRITCRSRASFINGKVRRVQVAPGIAAEVGKPAKSNAVRMRATRKVKGMRRRRKPATKKWTR